MKELPARPLTAVCGAAKVAIDAIFVRSCDSELSARQNQNFDYCLFIIGTLIVLLISLDTGITRGKLNLLSQI